MKTDYYKYAEDVVNGKVVAGKYVKLAAQRFLDDLKRYDFYFDEAKVARAVKFIGTLKHFQGKSAGQYFKLEPWQSFIVANIIGFYWKESGLRRYTSSFISVARKNGKTALSAALSLYALVYDNEAGAEVDLCANSKEQARIAFSMCKSFAKTLDPQASFLRSYYANINFDATDSKLNVFAADDSRLDGYNASFGLIDEFHAAKNSKVRDVIRSSMGMRKNPHLCTITTAGFDKAGPCYQLRNVGTEVLNGFKEDDSFFVMIFELDEGDDWRDESVWVKANPNIDVTVTKKYLSEQVHQAMNNPSDEVGVRTKNLNDWCDVAEVWIPEHYVEEATTMVDDTQFGDSLCYVGVDLAATGDLTAVAKLWVKDDIYWFKVDYYLPEAALMEKGDKDMYRIWARAGHLHITPGNVTDYDYITKDLLELCHKTNLTTIGYDKWNSTQWAIDATELGLPLMEYSQSIGNFNRPTREFERLMLSGKVRLDNNPITRFCLRNTILKADHNGNVKPNKGGAFGKMQIAKKIDGVIAMVQALGCFLEVPTYDNKIYIL